MRLCYVFQDEYPWDVRAEKFVETLADAGHHTTIVSRNRRGLAERDDVRSGVVVRRLPKALTRVDRAILNFPAFFSPMWLAAIVSAVRRDQLTTIVVRDLPLTPTAVWAGWLTGCPVVMDMAENYPAMIQATWDTRGPRPLDYLIRNPRLLRWLERWILPKLDGIIVVSNPSRERVLDLTKRAVPVWVVGNTPRLKEQPVGPASALAERLAAHDGLVLLYVGQMDSKRGLDILIRALPAIGLLAPNPLAVIVGSGTMDSRLRTLARDLHVEDRVLFAGWIEQGEVPALISASDIGLVPHLQSEHTDTTIPNKLYDYMAQAKPVLVTQCKTLREIVESYDCGRVYLDRDPASLAHAVGCLVDAGERERLGEAGRRAVEQHFHWARDAQVLIDAISEVALRAVAGKGCSRP